MSGVNPSTVEAKIDSTLTFWKIAARIPAARDEPMIVGRVGSLRIAPPKMMSIGSSRSTLKSKRPFSVPVTASIRSESVPPEDWLTPTNR